MNILVTFLVGAATALAVQLVIQFYVVPRVEKRKRREDRWERDVRDLLELLTIRLSNLANEAHAAQYVYREIRDDTTDEYGTATIREEAKNAREETWAYSGVIGAEMKFLVNRVLSINQEAKEIAQLKRLSRDYRQQSIFVMPLPEDDNRTNAEFRKTWDKDREAREALLAQAELLADLPHPPRAPWHRAEERWHSVLGGPDPAGQSRAGRR